MFRIHSLLALPALLGGLAVSWAANPVAQAPAIIQPLQSPRPAIIEQAEKEIQQGHYEAALRLYQQAVSQWPADWEIHNRIGSCYVFLGRDDEAIAAFLRSNAIRETAENHKGLGLAYERKDNYTEAVRSFQRVVILAPDDSVSYLDLGLACYLQGWYDEAVKAIEVGLQKDQSSPVRWLLQNALTRAYVAKGMYQEASALSGEQKVIGLEFTQGPEGAKVLRVYKGYSADLAGIRRGDILVSINDQPLATAAPPREEPNVVHLSDQPAIVRAVQNVALGAPARVIVQRDGRLFETRVIVGILPNLPALAAALATPTGDVATPSSVATMRPAIQIQRLEVKPPTVAPGAFFDLEVAYLVSYPGTGGGTVPVEFAYSILAGGKPVYTGQPVAIEAPDNQSAIRLERLTASRQPGAYVITVSLRCRGSAVEETINFTIQ